MRELEQFHKEMTRIKIRIKKPDFLAISFLKGEFIPFESKLVNIIIKLERLERLEKHIEEK